MAERIGSIFPKKQNNNNQKRNKQAATSFSLRARAATERIESETVDRDAALLRRSQWEVVWGAKWKKNPKQNTFYFSRCRPTAFSGTQCWRQCGGQNKSRCFSWRQVEGLLKTHDLLLVLEVTSHHRHNVLADSFSRSFSKLNLPLLQRSLSPSTSH